MISSQPKQKHKGTSKQLFRTSFLLIELTINCGEAAQYSERKWLLPPVIRPKNNNAGLEGERV